MFIPVIRIGNPKYLRLSKSLLERYQIKDKLELILEKDQIIIRAAQNSREGWAAAFKQMNESGDDTLLIPDVFEDE